MQSHGVTITPSARRNPQLNNVIERMDQVMLNMLCTLEMINFIWDNEERIFNRCLGKISWTIRTIYGTTSTYSPAQLVFNREMILYTQNLIDWNLIQHNKCNMAIRNNIRENNKRI